MMPGAMKIRPRPRPHRPPGPPGPVKPPKIPSDVFDRIARLPVFRMIAGSAVAVTILNWWNVGTDVVSEALGVDGQTAMFILGCGIAVCFALVITAVLSAVKGREVKEK